MTNRKFFLCIILIFLPLSIYSQVKIENPFDAVNIGLEYATEYQIQKQQSLLGLKNARLSISPFLPQLTFDFGNSDYIKKYSSDTRSKSFQFGVKQLVFNGGKTILNYQMAKISAQQQFSQYELNEKSFCVSIINSYFNYLTILSQLNAQKDLLSNAREEYRIMQSEYRFGLILESDLLEYEIRIMNHEDAVKKTQRQLETSMRSFKYLLGLSPEIDLEISYTDNFDINNDFLLESYSDFLWNLTDQKNLELSQMRQQVTLSKKQLKYQQAIFIPTISFETDFAVSGVHYPLTEPTFSLKFNIAFDNNPFLPLNYSNSLGLDDNRINKVSHSANTTITPPVNYFTNRKLQNLSMVESINNLKLKKQSLSEQLFSTIASHDDCLESIKIINKTLELYEKKLRVGKAEIERGQKKRIDYLKDLEDFAEEKIRLDSAKNELNNSWYQLELLTNIPLGELKDVCRSKIN